MRPTIPTLVTLAYDQRRATFFRSELFSALDILNRGDVDISGLKGSWAGALGQPQFMPSSYLEYAQDFDGDGRRDIWTSEPDVFASIAYYMQRHGWTKGEAWGREIKVPAAINAKALAIPRRETGCRAERLMTAAQPLKEWRALRAPIAHGRAAARHRDARLARAGRDEELPGLCQLRRSPGLQLRPHLCAQRRPPVRAPALTRTSNSRPVTSNSASTVTAPVARVRQVAGGGTCRPEADVSDRSVFLSSGSARLRQPAPDRARTCRSAREFQRPTGLGRSSTLVLRSSACSRVSGDSRTSIRARVVLLFRVCHLGLRSPCSQTPSTTPARSSRRPPHELFEAALRAIWFSWLLATRADSRTFESCLSGRRRFDQGE